MTAAEQAEQAAVDRLEPDRLAGYRLDRAHARDAADAASQVWRAIVVDLLLEAVEGGHPGTAKYLDGCHQCQSVRRALDALGVADLDALVTP